MCGRFTNRLTWREIVALCRQLPNAICRRAISSAPPTRSTQWSSATRNASWCRCVGGLVSLGVQAVPMLDPDPHPRMTFSQWTGFRYTQFAREVRNMRRQLATNSSECSDFSSRAAAVSPKKSFSPERRPTPMTTRLCWRRAISFKIATSGATLTRTDVPRSTS
jgi:hypothetical protein